MSTLTEQTEALIACSCECLLDKDLTALRNLRRERASIVYASWGRYFGHHRVAGFIFKNKMAVWNDEEAVKWESKFARTALKPVPLGAPHSSVLKLLQLPASGERMIAP